MEKISLLCVGRLKERSYIAAAEEYARRLSRSCDLEIVEIPEQRLPDDPSPAQIRAALSKEAAAVRKRIPAGALTTALCVEGRLVPSEDLAALMGAWSGSGRRTAFLIGGSFGLDPDLKAEAAFRLSLSPMTFPHHLARVMLLEQIYRSYQIRAGGRYHK